MKAAEIAKRLHGHKCGTGWIARCQAHDDRNPSLALTDVDGKLLVHCHAGCSQLAVIEALKKLGLWPEVSRGQRAKIVCSYSYTDELGKLLYEVVRYEPKDFKQRYPHPAGGWIWKKYPHQVLYRLREVLENPIIFVVEGERDVETLREHGFCATTNAGGANAPWLPQYTEALRGREVVLIPDRDEAGYERVRDIAASLIGHPKRLVYLDLEEGKDVTDWFQRGHSELELIALLESREISQ